MVTSFNSVLAALLALALLVISCSSVPIMEGEWEVLPVAGPDPQLSFVFGPGRKCVISDRGVDYTLVYKLHGATVRVDNECGPFARLELSGDPSGPEVGASLTWLRKDGTALVSASGVRLRRVR
jgi:hypothetical protein